MISESAFEAFEAVGALVVVLDPDDRVVYWNPACTALTGYARDEIRGQRFQDVLLVPGEVASVIAALDTLRATRQVGHHANHWVTRGGERRWIAWSNAVTTDAAGALQYFIKTGVDQTDRKRAEDARDASAATLDGIIAIAADAIISMDAAQLVTMYNARAEAIFGWTAAEVIGQPLTMLLPARFRDRHGAHVRGFANGDAMSRSMGQRVPTITGLRKNGEEFPAQAAISRLDAAGGQVFTVILRDVSETQQREKHRDLLARLGAELVAVTLDLDATLAAVTRLAVDDVAECCIVSLVDRGGRPQRTSTRHRDPARTYLGEALARALLDPRLGHATSAMVDALAGGAMHAASPAYLASIARDADELRALGELDPRAIITAPLAVHGERLGVLVLVAGKCSHAYGPAERRLAEEIASRAALAVENARLHERARDAAFDLREANQQMVGATIHAQELTETAEAAQSRAEASEQALREVASFRELFIGIVGHDLRNPLSAINLACMQMTRRGRLDGDDARMIALVARSSQRMTRMITQLLDLTRARLGGGFPLEVAPIDLRETCRSVVEEFGEAVRLVTEGDLTGSWDADRIAEALSNIVGNALEHAASGSSVALTARADEACVVVEVTNQGEPIPADVLPFIFEPFRQANNPRRSATGNLGLGLYIASQIVLSSGGTLGARSADGATTFVMRLPRQRPAVPPRTTGAVEPTSATAVPPRGDGRGSAAAIATTRDDRARDS